MSDARSETTWISPLALSAWQEGAPSGQATQTGQAAPAQGAPPQPSWTSMLMPVLLVIGVFYFVMIGPERKQRKARERMLGALKKGDRVITTSGMHATVVGIQEDVLTLQADEGVRLKFNRGAVQSVQNAGEKEASAK